MKENAMNQGVNGYIRKMKFPTVALGKGNSQIFNKL